MDDTLHYLDRVYSYLWWFASAFPLLCEKVGLAVSLSLLLILQHY